jgi:hypothetical protein
MRLIIDVTDDTPIKEMEKMVNEIKEQYREHIIDLGFVIDAKTIRDLDIMYNNIMNKNRDDQDELF